jgi:hypothetical protein
MNSIKYTDGYKVQSCGEYVSDCTGIYPPADIETKYVTLRKTGILIIHDGCASDLASGPTIDRPRRVVALPAFEHDALCKLVREGLLSPQWMDKINERFYTMLKRCIDAYCTGARVALKPLLLGRAWYWYRGVSTELAESIARKPKVVYTSP